MHKKSPGILSRVLRRIVTISSWHFVSLFSEEKTVMLDSVSVQFLSVGQGEDWAKSCKESIKALDQIIQETEEFESLSNAIRKYVKYITIHNIKQAHDRAYPRILIFKVEDMACAPAELGRKIANMTERLLLQNSDDSLSPLPWPDMPGQGQGPIGDRR